MEANMTVSHPASASMGGDGKKTAIDITSLMSPPDPVPLDNFNHHVFPAPATTTTQSPDDKDAKPKMPMSPPVSPQTMATPDVPEHDGSTVKDPILYPRNDTSPSPSHHSLFPVNEPTRYRRLVSEHIANRDISLFRQSSPPMPEDYELVIQVKSQVMRLFTQDRKAWMQKEREQLVNDRTLNSDRWNNKRYPAIAPAKTPKIPVRVQGPKRTPVAKPDRVVKPAQARPATGPRVNRVNQTPVKNTHSSTTPEPGRRVVAPNREDRDFNALEDLCPPISSLPGKPNSLKVDWKGAPVDLTNDPHANLLHADELSLAANLRLDCATYLTSKRRIFIRRRDCAKMGKEFRKTDAQQACKIDVNKASKLWTAFERVGWLDIRWMDGHY